MASRNHDPRESVAMDFVGSVSMGTLPKGRGEQVARDFLERVDAVDPLRQAGSATGLLALLEDECWDLRCLSIPTGGDDHDVAWVVVEHHMAEPKVREIGRGSTPMEALRKAAKLQKEPT